VNWLHLAHEPLLTYVNDGKIEERIEVMGRRGGRLKQLLNDLNKTPRYSKLKEEALYRTLWRTRFGKSYGPVARNEELN
jgi:hypothetical protein